MRWYVVTHVTQIRGHQLSDLPLSISELHMSHKFVGHQLSDLPLSIPELHMSHKFVGHQLSDLPLSISELHMLHTFVGASAVRFTAFYFWVLPFAISNIHLVFLLLYVSLRSEFRVRYDFHIKTSSPPVVCRRDHVLFTLFLFDCA